MTSIEVQVEACLAYIASQRGLGWTTVEPAYTDEGVSGGTLQRPALRALLDDVRRGKIDVVAAHRFDRISRSLFDLCDLVALRDGRLGAGLSELLGWFPERWDKQAALR